MTLDDLLAPVEKWEHDAACRGMDPDIFHPNKGQSPREAKRICAQCPVIAECFDRVMSFGCETFGVWAGTTLFDRRKITRDAKRAAALDEQHDQSNNNSEGLCA